MAEITGKAKFVRIAPDKIRVLSNLVKDKTVDTALSQLQFSGRDAAKPLILVLKQVKAQAKDKDITNELVVKTLQVNEGPKLKRRRIRQQGRATAILKRGSHITITVTDEKPKSKVLRSKQVKNKKGLEVKNSGLVKSTEGSV